MLIGQIFEETPHVSAAENIATRLADKIRNLWLEHDSRGELRWEDNLFEDPNGIVFLRREDFPKLEGIDYIFRWWGNEMDDGLAGDLVVLWKINTDRGDIDFYMTTIRFAERDFPRKRPDQESAFREQFRADFREAFRTWQQLYQEKVQ